MGSVARYWWQCLSCGERPTWPAVCGSRSVAAFIWDELAPSGWDQRLLLRKCQCNRRSLRITYRFRGSDPERISVRHIVGLTPDGGYLPMLWETFRHSAPARRWVDFKYQRGRSPWGLTKRLVLERRQLARLLRAYERATGAAVAPRRTEPTIVARATRTREA